MTTLPLPPAGGGATDTGGVALVWAHGIGERPASWKVLEQMAKEKLTRAGYDVKFVFPEARSQAVSVLGGSVVPSWFDIKEWPISENSDNDRQGMLRSVRQILDEVEKLESEGYETEKIIIGGFSQGGALAVNTVYRSTKKFAGCICLSGWLHILDSDLSFSPNEKKNNDSKKTQKDKYKDQAAFLSWPSAGLLETPPPKQNIPISTCNRHTPLFWGHGLFDDRVLFEVHQRGLHLLHTKFGFETISKQYRLGHFSHHDQIQDLTDFMIRSFDSALSPPVLVKTSPIRSAVSMDISTTQPQISSSFLSQQQLPPSVLASTTATTNPATTTANYALVPPPGLPSQQTASSQNSIMNTHQNQQHSPQPTVLHTAAPAVVQHPQTMPMQED